MFDNNAQPITNEQAQQFIFGPKAVANAALDSRHLTHLKTTIQLDLHYQKYAKLAGSIDYISEINLTRCRFCDGFGHCHDVCPSKGKYEMHIGNDHFLNIAMNEFLSGKTGGTSMIDGNRRQQPTNITRSQIPKDGKNKKRKFSELS